MQLRGGVKGCQSYHSANRQYLHTCEKGGRKRRPWWLFPARFPPHSILQGNFELQYRTTSAPPPFPAPFVTICHIRSPLMNLTGCEIRFVLFGPDGRVTEWSLTLFSALTYIFQFLLHTSPEDSCQCQKILRSKREVVLQWWYGLAEKDFSKL